MGFLDRLFGTDRTDSQPSPQSYRQAQPRSGDEIAVERYRYLLRTAPPEAIEQAHEEAFMRLTPEQRRLLFQQLSAEAPAGDQPRGDDPRSLAQAATRSELRQPGTMERTMQGPSFGAMVGSSLLGTVAGYVIGSAIVSAFLPDPSSEADASGSDSGDSGADSDSDAGSGDYSAGSGSDFGGGDFGGGFDF